MIDIRNIRIYHIVHVDRLFGICADMAIFCDAVAQQKQLCVTNIGMSDIKARRRTKSLHSYPNLHVGECTPFYFCPRSIMLYVIHQKNNPGLTYTGGQSSIVHIVANLYEVIQKVETEQRRWVFTDRNAAATYAQDYNSLPDLSKLHWEHIEANIWNNPEVREYKQAEFLIELLFPFELTQEIAVYDDEHKIEVQKILQYYNIPIPVNVRKNWYY